MPQGTTGFRCPHSSPRPPQARPGSSPCVVHRERGCAPWNPRGAGGTTAPGWGPTPRRRASAGRVWLDQWSGPDAAGPLRRPAELGDPGSLPGAWLPPRCPSAWPPAQLSAAVTPSAFTPSPSPSGCSLNLCMSSYLACLFPLEALMPLHTSSPQPVLVTVEWGQGRDLEALAWALDPSWKFIKGKILSCGDDLAFLLHVSRPQTHTSWPPKHILQMLYCSSEMLTNTEKHPAQAQQPRPSAGRDREAGLVLRREGLRPDGWTPGPLLPVFINLLRPKGRQLALRAVSLCCFLSCSGSPRGPLSGQSMSETALNRTPSSFLSVHAAPALESRSSSFFPCGSKQGTSGRERAGLRASRLCLGTWRYRQGAGRGRSVPGPQQETPKGQAGEMMARTLRRAHSGSSGLSHRAMAISM